MAILNLADLTRERREELGLSRERLAAKAETSTSTVIRIEVQHHVPGVRTLIKIANALHLDQAEVLGAAARTQADAA